MENALCNLLLHHDGNRRKRLGFQHRGDGGRRDIIRQIGARIHRLAAELFAADARQIALEHIALHDFHVVTVRQRLLQHRKQGAVQLNRAHLTRPLGQLLGQAAHARAYLQRTARLVHAAALRNARRNPRLCQKVLSERFGKSEAVPSQHGAYCVNITKIHEAPYPLSVFHRYDINSCIIHCLRIACNRVCTGCQSRPIHRNNFAAEIQKVPTRNLVGTLVFCLSGG